jgi:hypothetical protein
MPGDEQNMVVKYMRWLRYLISFKSSRYEAEVQTNQEALQTRLVFLTPIKCQYVSHSPNMCYGSIGRHGSREQQSGFTPG